MGPTSPVLRAFRLLLSLSLQEAILGGKSWGWWGWLGSIIGAAIVTAIVNALFPSVINAAWAILAAVIAWFNPSYVLMGIGGVVLFGLGVVVGRIAATSRQPLLLEEPPPEWISNHAALEFLAGHSLVVTEAKRRHEAGLAGFVGAVNELAQTMLTRFCQRFPSSCMGDGFARRDLAAWADQEHEIQLLREEPMRKASQVDKPSDKGRPDVWRGSG